MLSFQTVVAYVCMEGTWMKKTVHVLVQKATVATTVKVSLYYYNNI